MVLNKDSLNIYYDGLCPLCSREIDHYRSKKGSEYLKFVDITESGFDAGKEGLDPVKVHKHIHVKDSAGNVRTGVEAFIEIWKRLPQFNFMAKVASIRGIKGVLEQGYKVFAKVRPLLPRKNRDCSESPYCDLKKD